MENLDRTARAFLGFLQRQEALAKEQPGGRGGAS